MNATQQQGLLTSGSIVVPSDAVGNLTFTAIIPDSDYLDSKNKIWFRLYRWDTNELVWKFVAGHSPDEPWVGGAKSDPELGLNYRPYISTNAEYIRGQQLRAEVDIPIRMRVGVIVELGSAPGQP